jgi:hypothetical protein
MIGVIFELSSQLADEHVDASIDRRPVSARQVLRNLISGQNLLGMLDEDWQRWISLRELARIILSKSGEINCATTMPAGPMVLGSYSAGLTAANGHERTSGGPPQRVVAQWLGM